MSSHIVVEDFGGFTELDESGNTVVKSSEGFSVLTCNIMSATSLGFCEAKDGESRLLCPGPGLPEPAPDWDSVRHCRS